VSFQGGKAVPQAPFFTQARELAAWLRRHPSVVLSIDGYSDQLGPVASRFSISERRAAAVAKELIAQGVPRPQLAVRAFGHYTPPSIASTRDASRRATVHAEGLAGCPQEAGGLP
jgi:peptidoglycan-associated lipoprotein